MVVTIPPSTSRTLPVAQLAAGEAKYRAPIAISSATPLIGFPLQSEQNFNVMQVERHGAGLCMSLRNLRKGRLRPAINRVLNDKNYKKNMNKLQAFQETRDGPLEAAQCVLELIEHRSSISG